MAVLAVAALLAGCNQDSNSTEAPPKGTPPNTVQAPPGAKTPEQRGMENQANKGPLDGGSEGAK